MKVFELAKEFDMGAIELVEKLKASGMSVRNHMVSLDDQELTQARDLLKPVTEVAPAKKKVVRKKKVVKKAIAVKKASATTTTTTNDVAVSDAPKKKVKKKVVTVKRKSKQSLEDEKLAKQEEKLQQELEAAQDVIDDRPRGLQVVEQAPEDVALEAQAEEQVIEDTVDTTIAEDKKVSGLQVVFDPNTEKKTEAVEAKKPVEEAKIAETGKKVFKEKMHSFTPVYIPPVSEKKDEKKEGTSAGGSTSSSTDGDGKSKKRIGNLASLVSKKGTSEGKSQDLTMMRANEEMKLATTLVGQVVYIPARRKRIFSGATKSTEITEVKGAKRVIQLHGGATAVEIAQKLSVKFNEFADKALELNLLLDQEDFIGMKLATELAALYEYRVEDKAFDEDKAIGKVALEDKSHLPLRDPIITVMGHVDHGKTTLLDYIRSEKVASGEAGGITQHIGAYSVKVGDGQLTFLDTPGHAAFGAMRQRGADLTDVVILVVAADDGVMPQTIESIKFVKKAGVPVIVAVNKMDKEGANPDRIKQRLSEFEIMPEEWGGDTQFVEISALKGDGIDKLLEAVHLQAEMMELREDPKGKAEGIVIEAKVESGRGVVATVLVQKGTLKKGDTIVVGESYGRARSLTNYSGDLLKEAGPSVPVQIIGLNAGVSPGNTLNVVKNEREAKKIVDNRERDRKDLDQAANKKVSLEDFFSTASDAEAKVLNLLVRTDVQGSFEAIKNALESIGNDEVKVKVLGGGIGAITDNDVLMASTAEGYIIGFNMRPMTSARRLAEQKGVDIKNYSIIYELINDVKLALEGLLDPEKIEKFIGRAQVKETFTIPKIGVIAGSSVIDGKIIKGCNIRLLREGRIVFDGAMASLKRFKDDVKEVSNGYECGISLEGFNDIRTSDIFEAYTFEEKKRKLESTSDTVL